jgi:uncharacterized protein YihD (DUF1040 family)
MRKIKNLCSKPACLPDDVPLVDSLVNHLQEEWSQEVTVRRIQILVKVRSVQSQGMTSKTDQCLQDEVLPS